MSSYEEKLLHVLAGQCCLLDLSYLLVLYSDIFHDQMQLVNVAVSYLLNMRCAFVFVAASEMCSHESAPMRWPFGTYSVVFISVLCCGRDCSLVSENRL